MNTNYREAIGMPNLRAVLFVQSTKELILKQRKALSNIKHCANDQWQFVNSWYDEKSEDARRFMMDARELFDTIYSEAQKNVYGDGSVSFGKGCESYLKDIRFCGKPFLQTATLYYTAKLMEDSVLEVEGTEEDAERVGRELLELKNSLKLYCKTAAGA